MHACVCWSSSSLGRRRVPFSPKSIVTATLCQHTRLGFTSNLVEHQHDVHTLLIKGDGSTKTLFSPPPFHSQMSTFVRRAFRRKKESSLIIYFPSFSGIPFVGRLSRLVYRGPPPRGALDKYLGREKSALSQGGARRKFFFSR